ncbi:MAG TPA: PAS domain S-box protein [Polyangia bacterium]|nr:PAS domain S-box protein [Polyangia bacterium]
MQRKGSQVSTLDDLRRRAERTRRVRGGTPSARKAADAQKLAHELSVHEIELELQNEELRATALELAQSRDRYLELYDLAPMGYVTLDTKGVITEANAAATALLGLGRPRRRAGRTAARHRRLPALLSRADADVLHLAQGRALAERSAVSCELAIQTAEGARVPIYLKSKPIFGPADRHDGFLCVLLDLSELRRTEDRLRAEEARARQGQDQLREIAEHLEDALMLRERDGRFSYVSPAFKSIWGRSPAALLGNAAVWMDAVHPEDRPRVARAEARLKEGEPFEETFRIQRPEGETRCVRVRFFPPESDADPQVHTVGVAQDITAQRLLEEDLRQAQKLEAMGRLSNAIAHDFGNLLQGIMGCALIALSKEGPPERRHDYLERIVDAVKRGSDLVGQLMTFTRKKEAEPRPMRLDDAVQGAARLIERLVGANIRLEVVTRAPRAVVLADPVQIEQILINLAANARDAMPNGGRLRIETDEAAFGPAASGFPASRGVRLVIRDTGAGIDDATRARIFEPFFTTKPVGLGNGVGLSTVLAITRTLGGRVDVESEPGRGTAFVFHLPCTDAKPAADRPELAEQRFGGRALLVEDNHLARATIRHFLEDLGIEVLEAADVGHAVELGAAHAGSIDVCVSDVTLPDGTGPRLMGLLRARQQNLRALFISAHPKSEIAERGLLPESVPVLRKPFGKQELAARLAAILPHRP